jgi:hypothetical protein
MNAKTSRRNVKKTMNAETRRRREEKGRAKNRFEEMR